MINLEIERKFLVTSGIYKELASHEVLIKQGYICSAGENTVRIRTIDDKAFLTIKGESSEDGLTRIEWEREIEHEDAIELMKLCGNNIVTKIRYYVEHEGKIFEVDEFLDNNEGLLIAEVELNDINEEIKYPIWLGEEVTGQEKYYNSYLSKNPFKKWGNE